MISLLLVPFLVTVDAETHRVLKPKPALSHVPADDVDMLIFVSPVRKRYGNPAGYQ